ncbi:MAG: hypothetical protein PHT44_03480 [Candidatus Portnoybacteria bacterium]|nr:hypothetical protein [Candidatus Portnoybacteria bacterium]MDD4983112.1 hypothetical protein [Candidatus Portnoybacteria bacterium]
MLQILTSLLILLNPSVAFFTPNRAPIQDAPPKEAVSFDSSIDNYKLPISESMFLASQLVPAYPIRNWNSPDPQISAKIGLVFEISRQRILWQKDGLHESRPIASLTKLMTSLVTMENSKLDDAFKVSKNAVATPGELGGLIVGEELTVKNLLFALLVESSNDAAVALAEGVSQKLAPNNNIDTNNIDRSADSTDTRGGEQSRVANPDIGLFINLMNRKAESMRLADTDFTDPSGLDPGNRSSAWDLNRLMQEVLKYPVLQEIMRTKEIDFASADGKFSHHLTSTDKLLGVVPEIIAGKTGYTEEAGNCMILTWRAPNQEGTVVSVIMDSQDRMAESEALVKWTKEAFLW